MVTHPSGTLVKEGGQTSTEVARSEAVAAPGSVAGAIAPAAVTSVAVAEKNFSFQNEDPDTNRVGNP